MKLGKTSCCCGATRSNPCACMKKGVMKCSSKEPKCPCYREKDLKKSVEKRRFATYPTCANPYCIARVNNEGESCERHQGITQKAFDVAWSVVKSDPYYCEVCGKETDDFIDLDGDTIICADCFDPNEHVESSLVDLTGRVIHDPYGFPDDIREEYQ